MRIVVLGAGVVGVTSAWYLAAAGHSVTVVERHPEAALGTSYANAGQISPALSAPWSFPGLFSKLPSLLMARFPALRFGRPPDAEMTRFLYAVSMNATPERFLAAKRAMVIIGELSRAGFADIRGAVDFDFAARQRGIIVPFRKAQALAGYDLELKVLDELGIPYERLKADDIARYEPNLSPDAGYVGAIRLVTDESGDCRRFTQGLAGVLAGRGTAFRYSTNVSRLLLDGGRVRGVTTDAGEEIEADAVVLALGVDCNRLLAPLGARLPIYPVKGYSLTIAADSEAVGPRSSILDTDQKIGITNLGDRVRIGGIAELAGYDLSRREPRYAGLLWAARTLFPKIDRAAIDGAERWSGLRPLTPHGPPFVGRLRFDNLYVNAGHGTLGWTMSCGSGRLLADLVSGTRPPIDPAPYAPRG